MRMRVTLRFTTALSLALAAGLAPPESLAQDEEYDLRLTDRIGQSNRYRLSFEIRMRADYAGTSAPDDRSRRLIEALSEGMVLRTAVEYEQTLVEVEDDGTRVFTVRWHDFDYEGELAGEPVPPPAAHVEATRELLKHAARVRTAPSGRTLALSYTNPALRRLGKSFESLKHALPTYLPEKRVRVGESWSSVARFPVGAPGPAGVGSLELELLHELTGVREGPDGPVASIRLSGSYSRMEEPGEMLAGVPMHVEASLTGETVFDVERGRFSQGHYEIDMFALYAEAGVEIRLTGHADGDLELVEGS